MAYAICGLQDFGIALLDESIDVNLGYDGHLDVCQVAVWHSEKVSLRLIKLPLHKRAGTLLL